MLMAALVGVIGAPAAGQLKTHLALANHLPSQASIIADPHTAMIPTSPSAVCMVVFRTLGSITQDWVDQWMVYLSRLDIEAQGMFVNGARSNKYPKRDIVMSNRMFTQWAVQNGYLYSAEQ
jgi:hypothetical protein